MLGIPAAADLAVTLERHVIEVENDVLDPGFAAVPEPYVEFRAHPAEAIG